jgi:hypothetical protein
MEYRLRRARRACVASAASAAVLHGEADHLRQLLHRRGPGLAEQPVVRAGQGGHGPSDHARRQAADRVDDHLWFCLERRDKTLHCHELGVSHFIDDRVNVLEHLRGSMPCLYLLGHQTARPPGWVTPVVTWPAVLPAVLPELGGSAAAPHR